MNARTLSSLVDEELAAIGQVPARLSERRARITRWCPRQAGFGTRCYPGGRKVYVVQVLMAGRVRTVTIADARLITETLARNIARRVLLRAQVGENPADARCKGRAVPTYLAFLDRYWQSVASRWKPSTVASNVYYRNHLRRAFVRRYLDKITPAEVRTWFASLTVDAGPAAANRAFELLRAMFNKAQEWGVLPEGSNPCAGIQRNKLRKHECLLSDDELGKLGEALCNEERNAPVAVGALRLIALTGCRKSEIVNLCWSEVRGPRLLLHDAKTGPRTVWLGEDAQAVLAMQPRDQSDDRVFGALKVSAVDTCFRRVRAAAGLDHVRVHDLRHSFASRAAAMSETLPMIAKLLGHADISMTARYAHLDDAQVLAACERIGDLFTQSGFAWSWKA